MSQPKTSKPTNSVPLSKTDSQSSDYFDDDPEFAEALATLDDHTLFGSQPLACLDNVSCDLGDISKPSSQGRKRRRSLSPAGQENSPKDSTGDILSVRLPNSGCDAVSPDNNPSIHFPTFDPGNSTTPKIDTYAASKFGEFGDYFRRKRAKLQNQNADINSQEKRSSQTTLFKSLSIFITGRTVPSLQVLRALITQHGGEFHAYLDRKEMVTHVITSNLTPAKALEFKHMKVVRPEWLVDSAAANKLLPWSDYKWNPLDISTQLLVPQTPMSTSSLAPQTSPVPPAHSPKLSNSTLGNNDGSTIANVSPTTEPITPLLENNKPSVPLAPLALPVSNSPISDPPILMPPPAAPSGPSRASYAAHKSNPEAERLMKSAEWREAHTSASGETFIQGYYQHSRLHHLSKWKAEIRDLVAKAQEDAESHISSDARPSILGVSNLDARRKNKGKSRASEKIIMHCDFDSFFVTAGLITRPELKDKPVAVCHASGAGVGHSTSEIASASYAARAFGVKNGMSLGQARQLCPDIQTIPYEFELYKELSLKFYTILMELSDDLQAVSVDEALIEVTSVVEALRAHALESGQLQAESYEKQLAESIRDKVRSATGCEVSIGIGLNIMLARLATKRAKPAGSFFLSIADAPTHIAELDIVNLHGFARAVRDKAILSFGTSKLGQLAGKSKGTLQKALGDKSGERIWNAIRGIDDRVLESDKPRKSVSADVNYGIRFENNEHAEKFVRGLGKEVSDRLKAINKRGRTLTLKVMKRHPNAPKEAPKFMGHGKCETINKSCSISGPHGSATDDPDIIGREAWGILQAMAIDPVELRGIGIQIQKLEDADRPSNAGQGQLAMRFRQTVAKATVDKPAPLSRSIQKAPAPLVRQIPLIDVDTLEDEQPSRPRNVPAPLAQQISFIDVDALDDELLLKSMPGRKETPYDLTMLSQLDETGVAEVMNGGINRARSLSVPRLGQPVPSSSKAASLSPRRAQGRKQLSNMGPPTTIPDRSKLFPIFNRQFNPVADQELVSLNIDPVAYAKMPRKEQRALIFERRTARGLDGAGRPIYKRKRRFHVPQSNRIYKTVQAVKTELPTIQTAEPGAPAVTETGDIQDMMRAWVETKAAKKLGPDAREVAHFGTFLEKSMATDKGMQRAIEVMKWWKHVCMNSWGPNDERRGQYGREWWVAWWEIKDKLDAVVKSRFGGKLNLS